MPMERLRSICTLAIRDRFAVQVGCHFGRSIAECHKLGRAWRWWWPRRLWRRGWRRWRFRSRGAANGIVHAINFVLYLNFGARIGQKLPCARVRALHMFAVVEPILVRLVHAFARMPEQVVLAHGNDLCFEPNLRGRCCLFEERATGRPLRVALHKFEPVANQVGPGIHLHLHIVRFGCLHRQRWRRRGRRRCVEVAPRRRRRCGHDALAHSRVGQRLAAWL